MGNKRPAPLGTWAMRKGFFGYELLHDRDLRRFAFVCALLVPVFLAPLFVTRIVPGLDLPFHLALADMIAKAGDAASPYAPYYAPRLWPPPPALPWLLLAAAGRVAAPAIALHVVLGAYVVALPIAVAAFSRSLGSSALTGLLAFPLVYNLGAHYGFLGYTLSMPVLFALLASIHHALAAPDRSALRRRAWMVAGFACALYGMHLETFVIGLAMSVACIVLSPVPTPLPARTRAIVTAALVPATSIAAYWSLATPFASGPARRGVTTMLSSLFAVRSAELEGRSLLAELWWRTSGLRVHLLRGFRDGYDLRAATVLGAVAIVWLVVALAWTPRESVRDVRRIASRVAIPLIAFVAFVLLPHHFDQYEAMSISPRLATLVALSIVSVIPVPRIVDGRAREHVAAVALVATAGLAFTHAIIVREHYLAYAREVADFESVVRAVPPGERVVGLVYGGESRVMHVESILRALPSLYPALRPDAQSMVPLRYCGMRHIPCDVRGATLPPTNPWTPQSFDVRRPSPFTVAITEEAPSTQPGLEHVIARHGKWAAVRLAARDGALQGL